MRAVLLAGWLTVSCSASFLIRPRPTSPGMQWAAHSELAFSINHLSKVATSHSDLDNLLRLPHVTLGCVKLTAGAKRMACLHDSQNASQEENRALWGAGGAVGILDTFSVTMI